MFQSLSTYIGFRYARTRKGNPFVAFINVFSVAGIALGLAALITISSVMNGFEGQLKDRILGLMPHFVLEQPVDKPLSPEITGLSGIQAYAPYIETEALIQSASALKGVQLQGVSPETIGSASAVGQHLIAGEMPLEGGRYEILIGRALASALSIKVGDRVRLMSAEASVFTPLGRFPSQRQFTVVGIFDLGSQMDDKVVLSHIQDIARLLRTQVERRAHWRLFLDDAFDWQPVAEVLDKREVKYQSWRERQGPLFDAVKMEKNMMGLMLGLIIAVAAFNIVSAMVMVVTEKSGDIAILRTMGMAPGQVMRIFLFTGLYNGAKGVLFGLIGGVLIASQLTTIMGLMGVNLFPGAGPIPVQMQPANILVMVMGCLLLSFLATLYPAFKALKVMPAQALRYE
ncbi:Lipoprotein-releasing system transmembrane protein LolC [Saliniradius amylolyticus]|uniref:Lipoprotein-releasing system transmembrane protein LolC n=2 Tax=Saliniradius amylolyticus TaxID=2183582 RepID=A0A2S2E3U2_9ALTE|nr:Lipoprotein-releasing system transmembrane protein LolC [Saliniradius amylolyticus]